ncbi:MAG: hypothetical protein OCD76_12590 [Reichenbachiella sp.]
MNRSIVLLILLFLSCSNSYAQTKEEFISVLEEMLPFVELDESTPWASVDQSELLDPLFISNDPAAESIARASIYSNCLYFNPKKNELYSYSDYPFGKYYYDSMLVVLEDGKQFYSSLEKGGYFSEGTFNYDPDTLSAPVQSITAKIRYWYPDQVKVFDFDKEDVGQKLWQDGVFAELAVADDDHFIINIGPGDSLDYNKYYSTGYLEMRGYGLNKDGEKLSTVFSKSMYSMTGVSEMIDQSIAYGQNNEMTGEELGEYMVNLLDENNHGTSYETCLEGKLESIVVVVRLEDDWSYIEETVNVLPETVFSEGWMRENDLIMNQDEIHVEFQHMSVEDLITSSEVKVSNFYNVYLEKYQVRIDLRIPWSDNEYESDDQNLDLELENVSVFRKRKLLESSFRSSGTNSSVYYGYYTDLEKGKEKATRVSGEFNLKYATKVELKKLSKDQYTVTNNSFVSVPWEAVGYERGRDFRNNTAGQKIWAKNRKGEWLKLIEKPFFYSGVANESSFCFTGEVVEVYIAQILDGKEEIKIPFDLKLE